MEHPIQLGDEIRLHDGSTHVLTAADKFSGTYMASGRSFTRHEFSPTKWGGDKIGNTEIGVCAANSSQQMGAV